MGVGEPERWVSVAPSWLGHRAEPLIHERMWGCPRELPGHSRPDQLKAGNATGEIKQGHVVVVERFHIAVVDKAGERG